MGFQEAAGQGGGFHGAFVGRWAPSATVLGLAQEAASWTARPCDAQRNRQFLANFAFDLVQLFRCEEVRLRQVRSPLLAKRRRENHQLAQSLRELMRQADLGLDVSDGIQDFLADWEWRQAHGSFDELAFGISGH